MSEPVWKQPAWITAIAGIVSAFLTIPQVVGDYYSKQQDIELAMVKTEEARIINAASKQKMEFEVITNTLKEQGPERIFILRYLSATLDDEDAQRWAANEVERLNELAALQETLNTTEAELETKQQQLAELTTTEEKKSSAEAKTLQQDIVNLSQNIKVKEQQASTLQKQSGIQSPNLQSTRYRLNIEAKPNNRATLSTQLQFAAGDTISMQCLFPRDKPCSRVLTAPPTCIDITPGKSVQEVKILHSADKYFGLFGSTEYPLDYDCDLIKADNMYSCRLNSANNSSGCALPGEAQK